MKSHIREEMLEDQKTFTPRALSSNDSVEPKSMKSRTE